VHRNCDDDCGLDTTDAPIEECVEIISDRAGAYRPLLGDVDLSVLRTRPSAGHWSALEYAAHVRDLIRYHGWLARQALDQDRPELVAPDIDTLAETMGYNDVDLAQTLDGIDAQAARFSTWAAGLDDSQLDRVVIRGGEEVAVREMVRNGAHELHHHERDVRALLTPAR
jgi:hypothetical protein